MNELNKKFINSLEDGQYIQFYLGENCIYPIYSSYGELYIERQGKEIKLKDVDKKSIYRVYEFEDLEKIGKNLKETE